MTILAYTTTPIEEIPVIRDNLRRAFKTGKSKSIAYRKQQLRALRDLITENIPRIREALAADLHRPAFDADFLEINPLLTEVKLAYDRVAKWAKPEKPAWSFNWFAMKPTIRKEPKGVVLVMSPFNYPLLLTFSPLAGAIAAGNASVMKPSELAPACSALFAELVPKYLDTEMYSIVNGAIPETTKILELQWDHIFFTGGARVARIVLAAAAKHLTPVTTELGGKSPAFIDPKCDLKITTKRLLWGKVVNAGQTCMAPDYVLVPKDFVDTFVNACVDTLKEFFPDGAEKSDSFARIVTPSHFARVKGLLDGTQGKIVFGGSTDADARFIEPTLVVGVKSDDSLIELFGPILPIIAVDSLDEAIEVVNSQDHPLALYIFSKDSAYKAKVLDNTQSGTVAANETMIHYGAEGLPFGGTGPSGSGYATGKYTFDAFTHLRCTIDNPGWVDLILGGRYPPYTVRLEPEKKLRNLSRLFPAIPRNSAAPTR
ncbi:NAD-aldehyde dehydrogenase [Artomyces pyxidatus]|uniref:NAD-aldehyde dehydrogenase n=1 Tax=Artomyces pyxidatus TaxID=48021 RepID=A0ACB8T822_9AGAM|nr:NAD-aldehyde dehydrogenase [Artomyces pyxidatus]